MGVYTEVFRAPSDSSFYPVSMAASRFFVSMPMEFVVSSYFLGGLGWETWEANGNGRDESLDRLTLGRAEKLPF